MHQGSRSTVLRLMPLASAAASLVAISGLFVLWRFGYPLVWDDTSVYKIAFQTWKVDSRTDWAITFLAYIIPSFSEVSASGYRPIGSLLQSAFILAIDSPYPSAGHLVFIGTVIAILTLAFYRVCLFFVESRPAALAGTMLFLLCTPMVQSSWISYSGIPALVPLFTAVGMLLYLSGDRGTSTPRARLTALTALVVAAACYREFMVVLPLSILCFELAVQKRITKTAMLSAALVLACIFPTAIPSALFHAYALITGYDINTGDKGALRNGLLLPLKPVFSLGSVHAQLSGGGLRLREEVSRHLISIPSPSLLLAAYTGFFSLVIAKFRNASAGKLRKRVGVIDLAAVLSGMVALAGMTFANSSVAWPYHLAVGAIILIAWTIDRRLSIWTIAYLAPFYLVYTERLHLAYVMMPVSITTVAVLGRCWNSTVWSGSWRTAIRGMVGAALLVALLDAAGNPLAVRTVMADVSRGVEAVALKIKGLPSDRPIAVIGNAIHVDDLRIYLDDGYQIFWTVAAGHDRQEDVIETPKQLEKFLKAKLPTTDVYFLDVRQEYLPGKKGYHQHRFVAGCNVKADYIGQLHRTLAEYPLLDPLRWLVRREFYAFLGPPDLVDDFYYGPSSRPLTAKVEAQYHLYKVQSSAVRDWLPLGQPQLIERDYVGHSIYQQNGRFFAIPANEREFAYERLCWGDGPVFFEAATLAELKQVIQGLRTRRT